MHAGNSSLLEGPRPRSDEAFQKLLLRLSRAAAEGVEGDALIELFCRSTRGFFLASGAYFWRIVSADELVGITADGLLAERFPGARLRANQSAVAMEAIRSRRTVFVNRLDPLRYPMAAEFRARSLMAAPLVVSNEVIGATAFLHDSDADFFNNDLAAKATILAGQLGSLLEANRLTRASREESRRAEILAEVVHALHSVPDASAVIEALADRLRTLLRTKLVCVLLRQESGFSLNAVSAETPQLAATVRSRHDRKGLQFSADLAKRAISAGEPITVAIDPATHALTDLVPAGMLIAAPFRTSRTQGTVLVYPRGEGSFSSEEKSLISAIAGFGAVAVANAELYATASAQAHELHQLLEISSELGSVGHLDQFMQQFVLHAADFLGFGRAFVGLLEGGRFRVRWGAENGKPQPIDTNFPDGVASRALIAKEVFWTDDPRKVPGGNLDVIAKFNVRQLLAVPLLGSDGDVLGMFGVLDRLDREGITQEDIRRARALGNQVAVALEVTRNLHRSEQHRRRAESLMGLALELNSALRLPEFASSFVRRAADMLGAQVAALAVNQGGTLETVALHDPAHDSAKMQPLLRMLSHALSEIVPQHTEFLTAAAAEKLLPGALASNLGWDDCALVRLVSATGELAGVLCLANRGRPLSEEDEQLLQAVAGHASVALENARLFTRMDQANRHWMDIFDAIGDFIVVHDAHHNVLRANRSLADFIGVQPQELIGVNMRALLAIESETPSPDCPFCHIAADATDEFVHPVLDRNYLVSTSRIHSAQNESLQIIHVLKDITDRREAERRYRELFDNIQEGLFFSTPAGRFIEVNEALVRLLRYRDREELLQADIPRQIYFSFDEYQQFASGMEQQGLLRNFEATLRRRDDSPMHALLNCIAVRDPQGRVLQYRGLILDITGLKNFQAELQRERDFSGKILNNTQSLILVADTAGLISYVNRRWSDFGYEQAQLLGQPLIELAATPSRPALQESLSATLAGQQVDNMNLHLLRGDGRVGQFSVNLSPMRDEQGRVSSIVGVLTDITDAALLQAKLMQTEKLAAVGQLVSEVAHEVKNPLTAILGFADLLMENPELPESARKDLRVILQEAQRTEQIVQNLLSFARQVPPHRKPVQLNAIVRRTVQLRAYHFHSHGVQVIERLEEDMPYVLGDSHQLQQVFLNILNNAYDAVRETGRQAHIEIASANRGTFVEVSFRDNGNGITHPDRIFDPFFTTKAVGKGTGLGLSICYGIVHEHGGEILCHNNPNGEGATFVVQLPAVSESASLSASAGVVPR